MKIGVAFTGGTIGSIVGEEGYIETDSKNPFKLIDMYEQSAPDNMKGDIEFVTLPIYRILSEKLDAQHIIALSDGVRKLADTGVDGIIVTHGTDTLQYSAAMLSYAFGINSIPIVLVSSDYPLDDERANGLDNFACAVEFIRQKIGKGVFVSYKNKGDDFVKIHRATRVIAHMPYSASVFSVDGQHYARFDGKIFDVNKAYLTLQKSSTQLLVPQADSFVNAGRLIFRMQMYPGIEYPVLHHETKAVLLESYHSGTLCTDEKFIRYAKELAEEGIVLFVTGADDRNTAYETTRIYDRLKLKVLPRMSPVAAYCKLWLLLAEDRNISDDMFVCMSEDFA